MKEWHPGAGSGIAAWAAFFVVLVIASQWRTSNELARGTLLLVLLFLGLSRATLLAPVAHRWLERLSSSISEVTP